MLLLSCCYVFLLCLLVVSDPHSVASLLVQQLLSHFSDTFLVSTKSAVEQVALGEPGAAGKLPRGMSLRDFLCEELTLLLLSSIYFISDKVGEGGKELRGRKKREWKNKGT